MASIATADCFNASAIAKKVPSPFAAAPMLQAALSSEASKLGWRLDPESASSSAFFIIGKIGTTNNDSVEVCVGADSANKLAFQAFPSKQGRENAGFMPLVASKKEI